MRLIQNFDNQLIMTFEYPFQILGSESSQDIDVMIFVEELPTSVYECSQFCLSYGKILSEKLTLQGFQTLEELNRRKINANVGIVQNGVLISAYKGNQDETNNALFYTYALHKQYFDNHILKIVPRNLTEKIHRTLRVMLSFLTKSIHRVTIKMALIADWEQKIEVLLALDLQEVFLENQRKNQLGKVTLLDFQKTFAFQMGQCQALLEGKELYTKEEISAYFPALSGYLLRTENLDNSVLNDFKNNFLEKIVDYLQKT